MATLGEYLGAGSATTKLLLHLNGSSADSSGNGNNGTDTAITYSQANGYLGQGGGFNGTTSFITRTSPTGLPTGTGSRTMIIWVKNTKVGDAYFAWYGTLSGGQGFGIANVDQGSGRKTYFIRYGGDIDFGVSTEDGLWHMLAVTYDGTNVRCYKDALLKANSASALTTGSTVLSIGAQDSVTFLMSGAIDEVIIENVVWSAEKIMKYYTYTKGRFGII